MPADPLLKRLPQAATTGLFRLLDRQLRADPVLAATVKVFRSWQGGAEDKTQPSVEQCPWARLTPRMGPEEWWASSTMKGWLFIDVELWVRGTCYDDAANLWWAFQRAIYPNDAAARLAFQRRLTTAGAVTGVVKFTQPAFANTPETDGHIEAVAGMALEYRFDQNPTAPGL